MNQNETAYTEEYKVHKFLLQMACMCHAYLGNNTTAISEQLISTALLIRETSREWETVCSWLYMVH
jgi:hypothetical protein